MYADEWSGIAAEVEFSLAVDLDRFVRDVPMESRVLDFGCGYGRISKLLSEAGYRDVVGIDSSSAMIERGRQEFPELSLRVNSESVLPFPDNSFDSVIVCAVFTCITSHEARRTQIDEVCRVLKPDGLLHMVEFCSEPSRSFTADMGVPMLHSSPQELRDFIGMLQIVTEEIVNTKTIGGHSASSYRVFAKNSLSQFAPFTPSSFLEK